LTDRPKLRVPSYPLIDSEEDELPPGYPGLGVDCLWKAPSPKTPEPEQRATKPFDLRRFERGATVQREDSFDADEVPPPPKTTAGFGMKRTTSFGGTATATVTPTTSVAPDTQPLSAAARAKFEAEKMRERTEYFLNMDLDRPPTAATSSQEDFKSPPKQKKQRVSENSQESHSRNPHCTICMEGFNNGSHRAANLKCGHVFAKSCVEKWLSNPKTQRCPNCNAKAQKRDVRLVIPLALIANDTTEMDQVRSSLQQEQQRTNEAKLDSSRWKSQYNRARQDADKLKTQVEVLQREKGELSFEIDSLKSLHKNAASERRKFALYTCIPVTKEARNMGFDKAQETVVISRCAVNAFGVANEKPSGIVKVSLLDPRNTPFIKIHDQPIKDLKCSGRTDSLVLTTSLDKTLKITNLSSEVVCHTFNLDHPGWSCSWDPADPNGMFVGLQNNVILHFDIRKPSTYLKKLEATRRGSKPLQIHSLTALRGGDSPGGFPRGVIAGTPENIFFWAIKDNTYQLSHLEDERVPGTITSCCFPLPKPTSDQPFSCSTSPELLLICGF